MGQRVFSTFFENVTVAAVQDLFCLKAGAANGIELHECGLSAGGVTAPAEIRLRLRTLPTATVGSGGTTPTIATTNRGDTKAATATPRANDTAQATSGGTIVTNLAWQWNVLLPFQYLPAPEDREWVEAGEAIVLDIAGAPASTVVSGYIKWAEYP